MSVLWEDGDFTQATLCSAKTRTYPFEGDSESFYTEQEFMQFFANFEAMALNTSDPDDPTTYLVSESPLQDMGGGVAKWTRVFSRIPAARDEYESFGYTFPGYWATETTAFVTPWGAEITLVNPIVDKPGRVPVTLRVNSRVHYDYFLIGSGGQYETASAIPEVDGQRYIYGTAWSSTAGNDLPDRLLFQASYTNYSVPTIEGWQALIAAGTEIIAEESTLKRWRGNIYERSFRYVKAK